MLGKRHSRFWHIVAAAVALSAPTIPVALNSAVEPSIEDLKGRVANAKISDRPPLCLQICDRQLAAAGRFYVAGDSEPAKAALTDVVAFAELTRDYAIQSRKHEKQSEIAIRRMIRKLADLKHTISHEDQEQIQDTIDRLQRIRDDLLAAMFPKGVKK
jgi:hypothetical protein